jgi:hypothetical protein
MRVATSFFIAHAESLVCQGFQATEAEMQSGQGFRRNVQYYFST